MRVHLFSDLHLEFHPLAFAQDVRAGALADLVLLAGDIWTKRRGPAWAANTFTQPVAMVGGNHECYGNSLYATIAGSRQAAALASINRQHPIRFLERETWEFRLRDDTPVRLIGATLWTDFCLFGMEQKSTCMAAAHAQMNDFVMITIRDHPGAEDRKIEPGDLDRIYRLSLSYIEEEVSKPFDGITIVMTHHAPSLSSVPPSLHGDLLSAAYASNIDAKIEQLQPALWVHGHIHESADYMIGSTRVACNPRGYAPFALNKLFDPALVIEI